jgi:predicted DNA-binding transcriptional regulator YafY
MNKQRYISNNGAPYTVSPYTLVWDGDYYYMRGFCDERQEMRNFRIDRIYEQPKILNQIAVMAPDGYTPSEYSRCVFRETVRKLRI